MIIDINLKKTAALMALIGAAAASVHWVQASQDSKTTQGDTATRLTAPSLPTAPPGEVSFAANAPQLSNVRVAAMASVPLPVSEPLYGRIAYDENRTARISSPVAGRVTALHTEMGDTVGRGFVLASIDAPDLATAQADLSKGQSDEMRKQLAFERARSLFDGEVLARKDFESAQADYQQAQAETRRAALRISNLNAGGLNQAKGQNPGSFGLRSPVAGIVAERQINPGQEVRPDLAMPLFVVTDLRHLWLQVDVPERAAGTLTAGQAVSLETDAYPGQRFKATVERIGLTLDPGTRRIQVRCALDNPGLKLKPEMFARVSFLGADGARQAVQLPNTSLFAEGMYDFVFVEKRPGTFEKRRVNVALRGRDASFIDAGVKGGERVVTEGAFLLSAEVANHAQ
jgi:cobalt-zinc-cadmium efflux system membrane fusion protein